MKVQHKPIMLAYIIFLCICMICLITTNIVDVSFSMWGRIVLGATIASYAFTLASSSKSFVKIDSEYSKLLTTYLQLAKKQHRLERERFTEDEHKKQLLEHGEGIIRDTIDLTAKVERQIRKHEKKAFYLEVVGYLMFFCVLVFEPINSWLSPLQDMLTIAAFTLILLIEYGEHIYAEKIIKTHTVLIEDTKKSIEQLENENSR